MTVKPDIVTGIKIAVGAAVTLAILGFLVKFFRNLFRKTYFKYKGILAIEIVKGALNNPKLYSCYMHDLDQDKYTACLVLHLSLTNRSQENVDVRKIEVYITDDTANRKWQITKDYPGLSFQQRVGRYVISKTLPENRFVNGTDSREISPNGPKTIPYTSSFFLKETIDEVRVKIVVIDSKGRKSETTTILQNFRN